MGDEGFGEDSKGDEIELDTNLRDSMIQQSVNGSVLTEIRPNISQITEKNNLSVIARKSSTGKDSEIKIETINLPSNYQNNKENISYNPQVSGFMTLNANSKCPKMLNEISQGAPFGQSSISANIQNQ